MEIPDFLDVKNTVNGNVISQYDYTHDVLGRRVSAVKSGTMMAAASENLAYGYNARSELVSAVSDVDANYNYAYSFDDIGNRKTASEAGTALAYATNNLNQYTSIAPSSSSLQEEGDRAEGVVEALTYDADGNATLIQTATGTWTIAYNAENRPVRFENAGTQTVVECGYDSQGRRFEKKVTVAGTTTLHHRYIYRGYLQIAALDLTRAAHPALWLVTWDPSQSTATRPLALQKDGTWFTYGYDITKNVCELFGPNGYIRTAYSYTPFGSVSASENGVVQNFQWSSEFYDSELDLVYYNYRHYSPAHGRFLSRDPIAEQGGLNLYAFVGNTPISKWDILGKAFFCPGGCNTVDTYAPIVGYRPTPEQERESAIAAAIIAGAVIIGPALVAELSLTEGTALALAGKIVKDLSRKIKCLKCEIQVHKAHHRFLAFDIINEFPYVRLYECYRRHINIICYIKGKKGREIRHQIPFSKCMSKE